MLISHHAQLTHLIRKRKLTAHELFTVVFKKSRFFLIRFTRFRKKKESLHRPLRFLLKLRFPHEVNMQRSKQPVNDLLPRLNLSLLDLA